MAVLAKQTDRQRGAEEQSPAASTNYMHYKNSPEYKRWVEAAARYVKEEYIHDTIPEGWRRNLLMTGLALWALAYPVDHKKHVAMYPQPESKGGKLRKSFTNRLNKLLGMSYNDEVLEPQPAENQGFDDKFGGKKTFDLFLTNFDHYKKKRPIQSSGGLANFVNEQVVVILELIDPRNSASNSPRLRSFTDRAGEFHFPNAIAKDNLRDVIRHIVSNGY